MLFIHPWVSATHPHKNVEQKIGLNIIMWTTSGDKTQMLVFSGYIKKIKVFMWYEHYNYESNRVKVQIFKFDLYMINGHFLYSKWIQIPHITNMPINVFFSIIKENCNSGFFQIIFNSALIPCSTCIRGTI